MTGLLICGHLSDRIRRRHVLLLGVAISALSAVTFLLVHGLPELLLGRVLSGLSAGIFSSVAPAAIVDLVPREESGKATIIGIGGDLLGLAFGPLMAGMLAENFPFPVRIPLAADLVLVIPAAVALLLVPETVKPAHERFRLQVQPLRIPGAIRSTFIRATIAGMCGFAISGLFNGIVPSFLRTVLHQRSHALAGSLVFVFLGFAAIGQLGVGRLSRRSALPGACMLLAGGLGLLASGIIWRSVMLFFGSAVLSGLGDGLAVGFGLAQINQKHQQTPRRNQCYLRCAVLRRNFKLGNRGWPACYCGRPDCCQSHLLGSCWCHRGQCSAYVGAGWSEDIKSVTVWPGPEYL